MNEPWGIPLISVFRSLVLSSCFEILSPRLHRRTHFRNTTGKSAAVEELIQTRIASMKTSAVVQYPMNRSSDTQNSFDVLLRGITKYFKLIIEFMEVGQNSMFIVNTEYNYICIGPDYLWLLILSEKSCV